MFAHFQEYHRNHEKNKKFIYLQPSVNKTIPPVFFCLALNAFPDIGSFVQIEKKNLTKKSQEVLE